MSRCLHWVLLAVALAALAWSVWQAAVLGRISEPLQTDQSPRRMISLQLAPSTAEANRILAAWHCADGPSERCAAAREALQQDSRFILAYAVAGLLLVWWAALASGVGWGWGALIAGLILAAGTCDLAENWLLALSLGNAAEMPFARIAPSIPWLGGAIAGDTADHAHAFALARIAAMTKFALLSAGVGALVVLIGGALRAMLAGCHTPQAERKIKTFDDLVKAETKGIFEPCKNRTPDDPKCETHPAADEGYVAFREADLTGLALSGGGIRSATFNLGLLQGLNRTKLLSRVDYLSTVSGGGYVGAFWSAWLKGLSKTAAAESPEWKKNIFPAAQMDQAGSRNSMDSEQERHLREFSAFLVPRWGLFEVESWTAIVAVLAGLVPALMIGLAAIGAAWIGWLAFIFPLASPSNWAPATAIGLVTLGVLVLFELAWQKLKQESAGNPGGAMLGNPKLWRVRICALGTVALTMAIQLLMPSFFKWIFDTEWPISRQVAGNWQPAPGTSGMVRWFAVAGIAKESGWIFSPRLFDYGLVWLGTAFVLIGVRFSNSIKSWSREWLAAFDRVLARVLGLGFIWCAVTMLWHVACNLEGLRGVAAAGILLAGLFAALRNWIGVVLQRPPGAGLGDRLRPYLPQALAYLTLILAAVAVARGLIELCGSDWYLWWTAGNCMALTLIAALFVKPEGFGLHRFYRDRICRAYTGACNLQSGQGAADNRGTEPRQGDDILMGDLAARPLHLVCCAANDLSCDQVETLGRGARSAVLSKHGLALGSYACELNAEGGGDWLGSAITASAAAFNSNMGNVSVRVGPAVSFLMTALNLRLGLWVRHPAASDAAKRRWPGLLYYREMFGLTSSSGRIEDGGPSLFLRDVHLSDGGHFENLGLYELIRRHCRYVIVSDCAADPALSFHDLGNAIRRVREDFGVDIELDVAPLRPGPDSLSRQHVATGTIHYSTGDKGILLYIKPSITGDEPADIVQYRNRNTAFPHESTADQFYDEAQWESYRRLGLHAAEQIFEFVERSDRRTADWVFSRASRQWGPTPEGLESRVLKMTERFGVLESELRQLQSRGVLIEVFPEMTQLRGSSTAAQPRAAATDSDEETASELAFMLRVTQLMEDVWLTCGLDKWWAHPLNMGWINLFARWATCPSFRFWWPMLAPMFSDGFRQFLEHRFPVREPEGAQAGDTPTSRSGVHEIKDLANSKGLAAIWWRERSAQRMRWNEDLRPARLRRQFFENVLELKRGDKSVPMQTGLVSVTWSGLYAGWTSEDFFVPPSLWGAGIGSHFLEGLLRRISEAKAIECYVVVKAPPSGGKHQVALDDRRSFAEQHRRIGFRTVQVFGNQVDLSEALGYDKNADTLLALNLQEWIRLQDGVPPLGTGAAAGR